MPAKRAGVTSGAVDASEEEEEDGCNVQAHVERIHQSWYLSVVMHHADWTTQRTLKLNSVKCLQVPAEPNGGCLHYEAQREMSRCRLGDLGLQDRRDAVKEVCLEGPSPRTQVQCS